MPEAFVILLSTIFVNNFVMVQFLGLCPFMGASQKFDSAVGMAAATTFVLTLASAASFLVETYILIPFDLQYLRIIAFIVIIASLVQFSELVIRATQPLLHQVLGIFIPLITTNCAVLGVAWQCGHYQSGDIRFACHLLCPVGGIENSAGYYRDCYWCDLRDWLHTRHICCADYGVVVG